MSGRVLITGGAGFIGSHVADELLAAGYEVRILDSLLAQVHGALQGPPDYLSSEVEFLQGNVRDGAAVCRALVGANHHSPAQAVFHLAAAAGVGQSAIDRVDQATQELEKRGLTL